ncbi:short-chain fatty acid transporter [Stappia taiwanensis]|uniref:Short-chain fatty acid transporter n=1 Tax=Stappia taiwanensis TaxID=992267 RepID=A0A838XMN5_9HYPH|nr:short-chain fatty acid transporter [Stappia taiwanensis]MBA4611775.1 short-chain fatty acid transporter [Stappia taiwanensis]GGE96875.1 short-chain fatty acids transporter [Stappia taiwanensis]
MLNFLARPLVRLVDRYLPDPFIFVIFLTIIAALAAMLLQGQGPLVIVSMWGDGFWKLLTFSMQMLLVLVTGFMLASTPLVRRALELLASWVSSAGGAIILVSVVSLLASWINWGFGLVVGAFFAKELARQVRVDYRLLVASAYSGFLIWHGGLAGSVPLSIATEGHPFVDVTGVIGTGQSIFAPFNIAIVAALFIAVPLLNWLMLPAEKDSVHVDPALLDPPAAEVDLDPTTPAQRMENSRILSGFIGLAGLLYLANYFLTSGGLSLNSINMTFLMFAIVLHGTPRHLLDSLQEAMKGGAGIVLQFPFYAGIMAIMVQSGLATTISNGLISLATTETLPFWTFLSAGLVNMFVPSGGGQWAVQAPVVMPAAQELGTDMARAAMAVAWGDAWTNMIQPFWALPLLGIAGLRAKDIMGYCLMHLIVSGVIISALLTYF